MSSAMTTQRATLIGLLAPLCWGMGVSLVRGIAEGFGLAQGQTLLYITAAVCLFFVIGIPDLRTVDRRYLIFGLPTANASSLCFTLAIFFSAGGTQTMEAAMVNYLWPALTLLFAVVFNGVRSRWWIAPGMVLAFCGIVEILAGGQGFSLEGFISRLLEHPLSYILAVGAAVTWAAFSSMTRAWGGSTNLACLIFLHQRQHLRRAVALRLRHPNGGRTFGTRLDQRHPGRHCDGRRICCMDAGHDQREHHGAGSGLLFHAGSLVCFCSFLDWRQTRQLFLDGGRCCRCRLTALLGRDGARNEAALGA